MNNVTLVGRLCTDPELKEYNGKKYVNISLAVDRPKNQDGTKVADFIECTFWNKTAEVLTKYSKKGDKIGVIGSLRTSTYERQDGIKVKRVSVYVDKMSFVSSSAAQNTQTATQSTPNSTQSVETDPFDDFSNSVELRDEDLPF